MVLHIFESRNVTVSPILSPFFSSVLKYIFTSLSCDRRGIFHMGMAANSPHFTQVNQDYDPRREIVVFSQCVYTNIIGKGSYWSGLITSSINLCDQENGTLWLPQSNLLWLEWLSTIIGSLIRSLQDMGGVGTERSSCPRRKMLLSEDSEEY